ncbi:MAG: DUF1349 domain-containing protein [Devosia sp.]|nr:DUF1349 domain-containing protein [Devosia sp.]
MPKIGNAHWINPPPFFDRTGRPPATEVLTMQTGRETDFWNNTFYGFTHRNGHLLAHPVEGDFSLELTFSAAYAALYDQAGAMLRVDDNNWLKCGVEFTDGRRHFSVVVTRDDQSDWSVMPLAGKDATPVTLRLTRHGEALRVQLRQRRRWRLVRLAFLAMPDQVEVGPMCCSPTGEGLRATFHRLSWSDPIPRDLHD